MNLLAVSTNSGDPGPYIAAETAAIADLVQTGVIEWMLLKADHWVAVVRGERGALCSASGDGVGGDGRRYSDAELVGRPRTLTGNAIRLNEHPNLASERYQVAACN